MATMYILAGISGSGKTTYWKNNLSHIPLCDIAEEYKTARDGSIALNRMLIKAGKILSRGEDVAVEAWFISEYQMEEAVKVANYWQADCKVIRFEVDVDEAIHRVEAEYTENLCREMPEEWYRFMDARLSLLKRLKTQSQPPHPSSFESSPAQTH